MRCTWAIVAAGCLFLAPRALGAQGAGDEAPMVRIPAGEFPRGRDQGDADERPARRITLETAPVRSFPAGVSPYGVHDLSGNVWEWIADWYAADYYQKAPARGPRGPTTGKLRVVRGGSWGGPPEWSTTTNRYSRVPDYRNNKIGFRCARDEGPSAPQRTKEGVN